MILKWFWKKIQKMLKKLKKMLTNENIYSKINLVSTKGWQNGRLAQLGEHLPYKQEVIGSSPIVPTTYFLAW